MEEQERDVEVLEFSLIDEEIEELITKLQLLQETKEHISFDVDEENELLIHYEKKDDDTSITYDAEIKSNEEEL